MRRYIVGAIGGDSTDADFATAFGRAIADRGLILTTGGRPSLGTAVKNAAMRGAAKVHGRLIGFLPISDRPIERTENSKQLLIDTGLVSTERNGFTGLTPDVMVVFPGSRGTLVEMAFARSRGVPVILWNSQDYLRAKREEHAVRRDSRGTVFDQMEDARRVLPDDCQEKYPVSELTRAMDDALDRAEICIGNVGAIVGKVLRHCSVPNTNSLTGFPGRRDDDSCKSRFEKAVQALSSET